MAKAAVATKNTEVKEAKKEMQKETKVSTKKTSTKKEDTKMKETVKAPAEKKEVKSEKKVNKEKVNIKVQQLTNSELAKLFRDNGCATYTKANDTSNVVYNTFGTKSRILQQGKGYQLLLTNGHKKVKEEVVACDNDDTARFKQFYEKLSADERTKVAGYDDLEKVKLSGTELPRERKVNLTDYNLMVKFIQFMGTFDENKIVVTAK